MVLVALAACLALSGCGRRTAEVLTESRTGRRVSSYDVSGEWVAYVWTPAQRISTQGHLVALNVTTGQETELEEDLRGPMALSDGRIVWWNTRLRDDEGKSDVIVYDVQQGTQTAIAHEQVRGLDLDGDYVVWEEFYDVGSDIVLYDLSSGQRKTVSSGGREGAILHRGPRIRDGVAVWEAYDPAQRQSAIAIFDLASDELTTIDVSDSRLALSVSDGRIAYLQMQGRLREIHLYEVSTGEDRVVASLERFAAGPYIEGNKIAWCEHIAREDFGGIPGQPLMDEKDIRDVFVYEIDSGRTRKIAGDLLCMGSRVAIHDGRVYLNVYRHYPPPRSSNMDVPVDLWVW